MQTNDPIGARAQLSTLLCLQMQTRGLKSQREFAAFLSLGLTKVSGWLRGKGRMPTARDYARLAARLPECSEQLALIKGFEAARPRRPRAPRFKGFIHGDGI